MRDLARVLADLTEGLAAGRSLLLQALAGSLRVRLGVLSRRALADLRVRVGVPGLICAGCHGLEVEGPGISFRHPGAEAQRPALRALARTFRERAASIPGARVEAKELSVAVHYRTVPPQAVNRLERELAGAMRERWSSFMVLRGKKVIEILPRVC